MYYIQTTTLFLSIHRILTKHKVLYTKQTTPDQNTRCDTTINCTKCAAEIWLWTCTSLWSYFICIVYSQLYLVVMKSIGWLNPKALARILWEI